MKPIISAKEDENQTHTLKYGDKKQVQSALMYIKKEKKKQMVDSSTSTYEEEQKVSNPPARQIPNPRSQ